MLLLDFTVNNQVSSLMYSESKTRGMIRVCADVSCYDQVYGIIFFWMKPSMGLPVWKGRGMAMGNERDAAKAWMKPS